MSVLEYHGWHSYGPLRAYAALVDFTADEPQGFAVMARIAPTLLRDTHAVTDDRALQSAAVQEGQVTVVHDILKEHQWKAPSFWDC